MNHPPAMCTACQANRVAWTRPRVDYCYACLPGGPFPPPPCSACGSDRYFSQGLCEACHPGSPHHRGACRDCFAWGVLRANNWRCWACRGWRARFPVGTCPYCGRDDLPIGGAGACRLCFQQALDNQDPGAAVDLADANRYGQQLFLANLHQDRTGTGRSTLRRGRRAVARRRTTAIPAFTPVAYRQPTLFRVRHDLDLLARSDKAGPSPMRQYCEAVLREHADRHGWSARLFGAVRQCLRTLVAVQDTPGARIRVSDVEDLGDSGHTVKSTVEVLAAAGLLDDDSVPVVRRYFLDQIAELPAPMVTQLEFWYRIMTEGSPRPPRRLPRHPATVHLHIHWVAPTLREWAADGHDTLAEITPEDIAKAVSTAGPARVTTGQGLRSVFGVLKAYKQIFVNPTGAVSIGKVAKNAPMPFEPARIGRALNSPDPAGALAVALVAFHALTGSQIRNIQLTDIRDGRLSIGTRSIPLAGPVRVRLTAYLDHRNRTWPDTANPYLLINRCTAPRATPVGSNYPWLNLGLRPQALREDRILHEIHASGGDVRKICDLFGLTVGGAMRYAAALGHPDLDTTQDPGPGTRDLT